MACFYEPWPTSKSSQHAVSLNTVSLLGHVLCVTTKECFAWRVCLWWYVCNRAESRCLLFAAMAYSVWAWFLGFPTRIREESQELSASHDVDFSLADDAHQWDGVECCEYKNASSERRPSCAEQWTLCLSVPWIFGSLSFGVIPCQLTFCVSPSACGSRCKPCGSGWASCCTDDHLQRNSVEHPSAVAFIFYPCSLCIVL